MTALLKIELRRAFFNYRFAAALVLAIVIVIAHLVWSVIPASYEQEMYVDLVGYPLSVFNRWIGGWSGSVFPALFFLVLPLLVCLPYSDSIYVDRKDGWAAQAISRNSARSYYVSKFATAFAVGVVVSCVPLMLDFYLTSLFLPMGQPSAASGLFPIFPYSMWGDIYYSNAFQYTGMYLALIAVTSGLLACIPLSLSRVLTNRAIVLCSAFFLCIVLEYLFGSGDFVFLSPSTFMRPDQPQWGLEFPSIALTLGVVGAAEAAALVTYWRADESL